MREDGVEFARTLRGLYVRNDTLKRKPDPTMVGQALTDPSDLPLGFVFHEDVSVVDGSGQPIGNADKFARFQVLEELERDGITYVRTEHGLIAREHVRIARAIERCGQVGGRDRRGAL